MERLDVVGVSRQHLIAESGSLRPLAGTLVLEGVLECHPDFGGF
jgi:hypothetical protein